MKKKIFERKINKTNGKLKGKGTQKLFALKTLNDHFITNVPLFFGPEKEK